MLKKVVVTVFATVATLIPAHAAWVGPTNVNSVFVGSYGLSAGKVYVACSNGQTYIAELTSEWGKGVLTAALTAQSTGRQISVNTTTNGPAAGEFNIDRFSTQPQ
jgi:hypothetical protein